MTIWTRVSIQRSPIINIRSALRTDLNRILNARPSLSYPKGSSRCGIACGLSRGGVEGDSTVHVQLCCGNLRPNAHTAGVVSEHEGVAGRNECVGADRRVQRPALTTAVPGWHSRARCRQSNSIPGMTMFRMTRDGSSLV